MKSNEQNHLEVDDFGDDELETIPTPTSKSVSVLLSNNIVAVGFQIAATVFTLLMWAFRFGGGWAAGFMMPLISVLVLMSCVVVGYFLKPLPKFNFLSVIGLLVFILIFGTPYILGSNFYYEVSALYLFNMPAFMAVSILFESFGFCPCQADIEHQSYFMSFIAAFVPPLLMYLGLCLKIWRLKRKQL